ncbi:MAG TPA: metal-dependent transcriptional regulator [Mycobacteriales bacterium]|nr:metal-dependent transcriptional regulator [Mycobacteriales bacterium]
MSHQSDLIDTTEMYLRTVYELEEEGIVPLRARIAERLRQSGPTVSQTVARMQRDGLLTVQGDRHLELTPHGREQAIAVMRKHRLAECLLVDVIGLDWADVHVEACRWEHVMSEAVERRLVTLLRNPTHCPHGNPIPGLADLCADGERTGAQPCAQVAETISEPGLTTLQRAVREGIVRVVVRRISEQLQPDLAVMHLLQQAGVRPGESLELTQASGGVRVGSVEHGVDLNDFVASHVFVDGAPAR